MCQLRPPGYTQVTVELDWGPGKLCPYGSVRVSTSSSWLPGTMKVRRNPVFFYSNYSWRGIKEKLPNLRRSWLAWSIGWLVQDTDRSRPKGDRNQQGSISMPWGRKLKPLSLKTPPKWNWRVHDYKSEGVLSREWGFALIIVYQDLESPWRQTSGNIWEGDSRLNSLK